MNEVCWKYGVQTFAVKGYRLKETGFCNFSLGLLRGDESFKFHLQVFIDKKPENYSFANQTEKMNEAEVFARYLAK